MFTVCITANDDGTYKVYVEQAAEAGEAAPGAAPAMPPTPMGAPPAPMGKPPMPTMDAEAGEDPAEEANEPGAQTVKTIKDALTLALEALKNDGQMSDVNGQDNEFAAGFEGGAA